nr:LuxR C-terminal-related transcriptional regulator [Pseudomarimonas arenosa]
MSTPEVIDRPAARSGKGAALLERGAKQLACTHRITDRELSVLSLLLTDLSLAAIARTLGMGVETVRSHNRSIFLKCGVKSRIALILLVVDMADCTAIA